ncbi:MAG: N utilization substance protein B [Legionellales bacterium RIFCSPHIGHO2_12_FULL_37_14]|nr:MAG: N utilization substance protein B [Legionellales bacterium RIFCSPHIGHO2_12_FULL_37_14]
MNKQQIRARQRARELAVQAVYQSIMANQPMVEVEAHFQPVINKDKMDVSYFVKLIKGVEANLQEIDTAYTPYLDRKPEELSPVEKSILRLASFELIFCPDIPFKVVLEEAVLLAKTFGAQDSFRYVNGVLNQLAGKVRVYEKAK